MLQKEERPMSDTGRKSATHPEMDIARIEQTLLASIKLMKRGRREMERMRRKSRHEHPGQGQSAA
jgi:hypothetical protein